jgi:hypothetical protein
MLEVGRRLLQERERGCEARHIAADNSIANTDLNTSQVID